MVVLMLGTLVYYSGNNDVTNQRMAISPSLVFPVPHFQLDGDDDGRKKQAFYWQQFSVYNRIVISLCGVFLFLPSSFQPGTNISVSFPGLQMDFGGLNLVNNDTPYAGYRIHFTRHIVEEDDYGTFLWLYGKSLLLRQQFQWLQDANY